MLSAVFSPTSLIIPHHFLIVLCCNLAYTAAVQRAVTLCLIGFAVFAVTVTLGVMAPLKRNSEE
jgi:hypothetical protein